MNTALTVVTSKATRAVLADLVPAFEAQSDTRVALESVGGVDAARRVRDGERFDVVVLASDAIEALLGDGHLLLGSRVDLAHSSVAVAVRSGTPHPDIGSEPALRDAVLAARSIARSTGPSGVALDRLFQRWGIVQEVQERTVVAPVGVPVATLVARGEVELGFQQLSEL
jgi:molybdate transport system substrate-binding protein